MCACAEWVLVQNRPARGPGRRRASAKGLFSGKADYTPSALGLCPLGWPPSCDPKPSPLALLQGPLGTSALMLDTGPQEGGCQGLQRTGRPGVSHPPAALQDPFGPHRSPPECPPRTDTSLTPSPSHLSPGLSFPTCEVEINIPN